MQMHMLTGSIFTPSQTLPAIANKYQLHFTYFCKQNAHLLPQQTPAYRHQGALPVRSCRLFNILQSTDSSSDTQVLAILSVALNNHNTFEPQEEKCLTTKRDRK